MKKGIFIICLFIIACQMPVPTDNNSIVDSTSVTNSGTDRIDTIVNASPITEAVSNWNYDTKTDPMDSRVDYFANCTSTNTVYFHSPYDGGSSFDLRVQKYKGSNDVLIYAHPGQFLSSIEDDKQIRIKFDNEKPFYITCGEPSDGSSDVIFLYPSKKIISKLKKAKTVIIEPEFFEDGYKQISFNVSGLEWKH